MSLRQVPRRRYRGNLMHFFGHYKATCLVLDFDIGRVLGSNVFSILPRRSSR